MQKKQKNKGQSLVEVIIALTIGVIFIATAAGAISVSLRSNFDSRSLQTANNLAQETMDNVSALSESNWYNIYNRTKSSQHYYINSSRQITLGDESVVVDGKSYARYFIVENVYRNSCGVGDIDPTITSAVNCPSSFPGGASDFDEDPSTQKITVSVELSGSKKANLVKYISRFRNSVLSQKDWSGGANSDSFGALNKFYSSNNIISSVPGEITLDNLSWGAKTIDTNSGQYPSITAPDKNNIFISYRDFTIGGLKFAKSTDGGATWPTKVAVDASGGYHSSIVALDSNRIFISYYTGSNLKFASSSNGGVTWTTKTIDSTSGTIPSPSIVAVKNTNTIFISYYYNNGITFKLKLAKSTDGGNAWIKSDIDAVNINSSSMSAPDQNNIFISYYDQTNGNLKLAKSIDSGTSWTKIIIASSVSPASIIAVDANTIFVSGYLFNAGSVGFFKSTDGGSSWASSVIVANARVNGSPAIAALDTNTIFISYLDVSAGQRVGFAKSTDGGNNWTTTIVETTTSIDTPSIAVTDANNIFISYYDGTNKYLKFANSTVGCSSSGGDLTSSTFDTQSTSTINSIDWWGNLNSGSVKFQIATSTSATGGGGWSYQGPSGIGSYFGNNSASGDSTKVNSKYFNNFRYFRYKIFLTCGSQSPKINNVIINWSPQ